MPAERPAVAMSAPLPQAPRLRVLLLGASGFIGRHVRQALLAAGHAVRVAGRPALDYRQALTPARWLPLLGGVDAVINTVGVLRDSARQPMQALHADAPCALFEACAQAGVRRVLHLSALGVAHGNTPYARSKRQADAQLLALTQAGRLNGLALRPSLVFGPGGASTGWFLALARWPALALPRAALQARVQPLSVWDLAQALARAVAQAQPCGVLDVAGPQALSLPDYIALLRPPGRPAACWPLPDALARLSARLGDRLPASVWCSQSLALLAHPNTTEANALPSLLGRPPLPPAQFYAALQAQASEPS